MAAMASISAREIQGLLTTIKGHLDADPNFYGQPENLATIVSELSGIRTTPDIEGFKARLAAIQSARVEHESTLPQSLRSEDIAQALLNLSIDLNTDRERYLEFAYPSNEKFNLQVGALVGDYKPDKVIFNSAEDNPFAILGINMADTLGVRAGSRLLLDKIQEDLRSADSLLVKEAQSKTMYLLGIIKEIRNETYIQSNPELQQKLEEVQKRIEDSMTFVESGDRTVVITKLTTDFGRIEAAKGAIIADPSQYTGAQRSMHADSLVRALNLDYSLMTDSSRCVSHVEESIRNLADLAHEAAAFGIGDWGNSISNIAKRAAEIFRLDSTEADDAQKAIAKVAEEVHDYILSEVRVFQERLGDKKPDFGSYPILGQPAAPDAVNTETVASEYSKWTDIFKAKVTRQIIGEDLADSLLGNLESAYADVVDTSKATYPPTLNSDYRERELAKRRIRLANRATTQAEAIIKRQEEGASLQRFWDNQGFILKLTQVAFIACTAVSVAALGAALLGGIGAISFGGGAVGAMISYAFLPSLVGLGFSTYFGELGLKRSRELDNVNIGNVFVTIQQEVMDAEAIPAHVRTLMDLLIFRLPLSAREKQKLFSLIDLSESLYKQTTDPLEMMDKDTLDNSRKRDLLKLKWLILGPYRKKFIRTQQRGLNISEAKELQEAFGDWFTAESFEDALSKNDPTLLRATREEHEPLETRNYNKNWMAIWFPDKKAYSINDNVYTFVMAYFKVKKEESVAHAAQGATDQYSLLQRLKNEVNEMKEVWDGYKLGGKGVMSLPDKNILHDYPALYLVAMGLGKVKELIGGK